MAQAAFDAAVDVLQKHQLRRGGDRGLISSGKPKVWLDADEGRADNADVARRKAYTAVVRREDTAILADELLKLPQGRATRPARPRPDQRVRRDYRLSLTVT